VHYPLLPLLLNTANVKVHRGDKVEESDPGIINNLVCRRSNAPHLGSVSVRMN
jgi:hypothetical protein